MSAPTAPAQAPARQGSKTTGRSSATLPLQPKVFAHPPLPTVVDLLLYALAVPAEFLAVTIASSV
jgi:hypothetical protein